MTGPTTEPEDLDQDTVDLDGISADALDPDTEPSAEDLEGLEDEDIEEMDDEDEADEDSEEFLELKDDEPEEDDEEDESEATPAPLTISGFDDQDEADGETDADEDGEDDTGSLEDELEEDLAVLLDERLAEEDIEAQESGQGNEAEMACNMCFLLVTASQFGSPKNPKCPSDELECPVLEKLQI